MTDTSFQGANILFVSSFGANAIRKECTGFFFFFFFEKYKIKKIKKKKKRTYNNIKTISTAEEDNRTTGCLFDYPYFRENCKLTVMDLRKQQALDANPKANAANKFYRKF